MTRFRNYGALLLVIVIFGCSAKGALFAAPEPSDAPLLIVYRIKHVENGGMFPQLLLDGQEVGNLKQGGYIYIETTPGEHVLTVKDEFVWKWGIDTQPITIELESGEIRYVRLFNDAEIRNECNAAAQFGLDILMLGQAGDGWFCDVDQQRSAAFIELPAFMAIYELEILRESQ
jgi:hypothetical protein